MKTNATAWLSCNRWLWLAWGEESTGKKCGKIAGRITGKVSLIQDRLDFWLTTVYGPVDDTRKDDFLAEIAHAAPPQGEPWLLNGDFNIIYEARDKNNSNINRRIMGKFRAAIVAGELREIKCENGCFTWSSERQDPTLASIDKFFCTVEWDGMFPDFMLHAASTSCSDHCPLLLVAAATPRQAPRFRFILAKVPSFS